MVETLNEVLCIVVVPTPDVVVSEDDAVPVVDAEVNPVGVPVSFGVPVVPLVDIIVGETEDVILLVVDSEVPDEVVVASDTVVRSVLTDEGFGVVPGLDTVVGVLPEMVVTILEVVKVDPRVTVDVEESSEGAVTVV